MRILILSFYYPPDLSAGSFRTAALVDSLLKHVRDDISIDVVTTQPNRYRALAQSAPGIERRERLTVHRIKLPPHHSGMIDQSKAFFSYFRGALKATKGRQFDLVYATSSRLFTGFLGARLARSLGCPLYLDIRDIFVDTIDSVVPRAASTLLHPFLSLIERYTIGAAQRVNLVSGGFLPYFQTRYPDCRFDLFTNGIDEAFLEYPWQNPAKRNRDPKIKVMYAGNIGEGQGLHRIIPQLAKALAKTHSFLVVGDGGRRAILESELARQGVLNVELHDPVRREQLLNFYDEADVLFLHLNDYDAFTKVLPSKVFEYAATGKPILAGVSGYCAQFITEEISTATVFPPCNVESGIRAMTSLKLDCVARRGSLERYRRVNIMNGLSDILVEMARPRVVEGVLP